MNQLHHLLLATILGMITWEIFFKEDQMQRMGYIDPVEKTPVTMVINIVIKTIAILISFSLFRFL